MKKLILICLLYLIPIYSFADSLYMSGDWYDSNNAVFIHGLSVQKINSFTYYKAVDLQCDNEICEMKSAILSNVGINKEKIWNIYPQYQTYDVISFDDSFIVAKNGAGTLLKISRKYKTVDWIICDKNYPIITNQNNINKILSKAN